MAAYESPQSTLHPPRRLVVTNHIPREESWENLSHPFHEDDASSVPSPKRQQIPRMHTLQLTSNDDDRFRAYDPDEERNRGGTELQPVPEVDIEIASTASSRSLRRRE